MLESLVVSKKSISRGLLSKEPVLKIDAAFNTNKNASLKIIHVLQCELSFKYYCLRVFKPLSAQK